MNAEKFGQWTKNNHRVVQTDNIVIGGKRERKKFWLRIKSVHIHDKGLYSFRVNDTVVGQWQLQVKGNCKGLLFDYVSKSVSQSVQIIDWWPCGPLHMWIDKYEISF